MTVKPITPDEVVAVRARSLPPEVIAVWNELIAENWNGASSRVFRRQAIERLADRLKVEQHEVGSRGYLWIESVFEEAGWKVEYDRPGFNESYPATYLFTKRTK